MFEKAKLNYSEYFKENGLVLKNTQPVSFDTHILTHNKFKKELKEISDDDMNFKNYYVSEGKRADSVSYELYGSYEYWWTILYFNNFYNSFLWPLSNRDLQKLAEIVFNESEIYANPKVCFDLLYEQNEMLRNIRVIIPRKIEPLMKKLGL